MKKKTINSIIEPDYKGFGEHILEWDEKGVPYGNSDLLKLADRYHTPKPFLKDGKIEFEK
jgi:hypothetical protein